ITRGFTAATPGSNMVQIFLSVYLTKARLISWPGGRMSDSREGPGMLLTNAFSNPSPGQEILLNSMTNRLVKLYYLIATLVTSATVANRQVQISLDGNAAHQWPGAPAAQAASATVTYCFCRGTTQYTDARGLVVVPLPEFFAQGQGPTTIQTVTTNLQAGDQWTTLNALVETWC